MYDDLNLGSLLSWIQVVTDIIMWIALALTVISLADYIVKNRNVLKEQK